MKHKKWYAAVLILGLLAIAFCYGGNYADKGSSGAEKSSKSVTADSTVVPQSGKSTHAADTKSAAAKKLGQSAVTGSTLTAVSPPSMQATQQKTTTTGKQSTVKTTIVKKTIGKKDKYLTDPIPAGKPKPVEWQNADINKNKKLTCTLSITCKTILNNMDKFNKDKLSVLPSDGVIYTARKVTFNAGESVFDVLLRETRNNKIHMEFEMTPIYNSNYIEGINNLYEFDCGELSGWMYKVNGWFPNYGCSRYLLKDGDTVDWMYTCDLGRDIGGGTATGE